MKILVTGGLGFIGSNWIKFDLERHPDDFVTNLDKKTYAANPLAEAELSGYSNYRLVVGDIRDSENLRVATTDKDAIVNFAAETHVDRSIIDPFSFASTNVIGTLNLLEVARKNEVKRFHHVSTDEVFGSLTLDSVEKFVERSRYDPRNPYSASKASSDFFVRAYHETYGLETTITNCSNNFGPYQHPEKLIPKTVLNALENRPVPIYGDGRHTRDWLYVYDHCSAIDLVLRKGRAGESYCVSASNEISNLELVKMILNMMGKDSSLIQFVKDRPGHDRRYSIDATKIISELGWKPEKTFHESLEATINWYKTNHESIESHYRGN